MSKESPSQSLKQVLLRLPDGVKTQLEQAATENGRSLTAEVLIRLESTFPKDQHWSARAPETRLDQLERILTARIYAIEQRLDELTEFARPR